MQRRHAHCLWRGFLFIEEPCESLHLRVSLSLDGLECVVHLFLELLLVQIVLGPLDVGSVDRSSLVADPQLVNESLLICCDRLLRIEASVCFCNIRVSPLPI